MTTAYETIEESLDKILKLMDFDVTYSIKEQVDPKTNLKTFTCYITAEEDSRFLIGQHGSNMYALEHLLRSILYKNGHSERISIDINSYKEERDKMIARIAKDTASQALKEKKPIVLRPMTAYERRLVHVALSDSEKVETESIGESSERKVVIKPKSVMNSL